MFRVSRRRLGPSSRSAAAALALAGATLVAGATAGGAAAQDTTIVLGGPSARSLAPAHVTVAAGRPAQRRGSRIVLPTTTVTVAAGARQAVVDHGGTIALRSDGRRVVLSQLQVAVGPRSRLTAVVGGTRRTIATIAAGPNRRDVEATGTYVTEAPLALTPATVRLLRTALEQPELKGGRLGTIDLQASTTPATATTGLPGAPGVPTVTGPPTPGGAALAARPAGAVAITGGTVTWAPRASWLGYLQGGGAGAGALGDGGATFDGTAFSLPIRSGWFDAASATASVTTAGTTRFVYPAHGIDMAFSGWTYDLAGTAPKAVARVVALNGDAKAVGTTQPVALVKPAGIRPVVAADGRTVTWSPVPLTLSAEGVPLYRAYLYDSDQGSIAITATLG
jgi:hypothetical protein